MSQSHFEFDFNDEYEDSTDDPDYKPSQGTNDYRELFKTTNYILQTLSP